MGRLVDVLNHCALLFSGGGNLMIALTDFLKLLLNRAQRRHRRLRVLSDLAATFCASCEGLLCLIGS